MNLYDVIARIASGDIDLFIFLSGLLVIGAVWWLLLSLLWHVTVRRES